MEIISDLPGPAARREAGRPAISFADQAIDYTELEQGAGRIAHKLRQRDVAPGAHVAVRSRNHPAFFEKEQIRELTRAVCQEQRVHAFLNPPQRRHR